MNEVPTVTRALLTLTDILAEPVTSKATPGVVLLMLTLLFTESTKSTCVSKATLPATVCDIPDIVTLPPMDVSPLKLPVLALTIHLAVLVPNIVPTVLDDGLIPVPPEEVIPAGVIATLTDELPIDIVVALAKKPFDVALIVAEPKPVDAFTWPVIVAPAPPVIRPDVSIVFADSTNLPLELPSNIVLDVGAIAVVLATKPDVV